MSQQLNQIKPQGISMADWVESRIARFEGRKYDWNALKFQADFDPKYRRAQMRYIGTGRQGLPTMPIPFPRKTLPSQPWYCPQSVKDRCTCTLMLKKSFSCSKEPSPYLLKMGMRSMKPCSKSVT